jgi:hypothetical protein
LAVTGVFFIGAGIHQLQGCHSHKLVFERHVAEICVQAAERTCEKHCKSGNSE